MSAARQPHALGQLIRDVQRANGWSYADISANAGRAGRRLSRSRVESLRNDPLPSIGIKAIEALAAGLSVAPGRVVAAAIQSMGYEPTPRSTTASAAEALQNDPMLSASMRRVLLAALEAAHDEYHRPSSAEPTEGPKRRRGQLAASEENRIEDIAADDD